MEIPHKGRITDVCVCVRVQMWMNVPEMECVWTGTAPTLMARLCVTAKLVSPPIPKKQPALVTHTHSHFKSSIHFAK